MIDLSVLPAFVAVILLFLLPPGPDMAYMIAVGLEGGRRASLAAICGIGTGMGVYATAVVLGLGTFAEAHPMLLDVVKVCGAAYLLWLSGSTLRSASGRATDPRGSARGRWYRRGLVVAVTNPKIILFFLAVLPGFIGSAESPVAQLAVLGAVNVSMEVVLYGTIGILAGSFHEKLDGSQVAQTRLSRAAALVYLVLAVVIAAEGIRGLMAS